MSKYYHGNGVDLTNGLIHRRISDWIRNGVKCREGETYVGLHNIYHNAVRCEACKILFEGGRGTNTGQTSTGKCLDHDHKTGYFRQIICRRCNTKDNYYLHYMADWCNEIAKY